MHFFNPDITRIKIYSDQEDATYYIGEDAFLKADFENPSAVRYFTWQKEIDGRTHAIDTKYKSKYEGTTSKHEIERPLLVIRNCDKSDAGTYTILVSCKDVEIYSNKIHLKVVTGTAFVHFNIRKPNYM